MKKKILIIGASKGIGRCTREILQKILTYHIHPEKA